MIGEAWDERHDDDCESEPVVGLGSLLVPCGCERRRQIDEVLELVREELIKATGRFGPFASSHEGYAVILEELDELWDDVKANRIDAARLEAVQVSAMAARFLLDVKP